MSVCISKEKVLLLGGLYCSQFLAISFIFTALPAILRSEGADLNSIAWLYSFGLIWSIKLLWAPLVDAYGSRKFGHYRSWILILQPLMVFSILLGAIFPVPESLGMLGVALGFLSICSATQDIAVDALAVKSLSKDERGLGNSIQTTGGFIGSIIGGGFVLLAYDWLGWKGSMFLLALMTTIPLLMISRYKEQGMPSVYGSVLPHLNSSNSIARTTGGRGYLRALEFLTKRENLSWILTLIAFSISISAVATLLTPMLVDFGWSLQHIGIATNIIGPISGVLGAFSAGSILLRMFKRKTSILICGLFMVVAIATLLLPAGGYSSLFIIYGVIVCVYFGYGMMVTVFYTVMMDKSSHISAGTDYTVQYSCFSIIGYISAMVMMSIASDYGYSVALYCALSTGMMSIFLVIILSNSSFTSKEIISP